MSWEKIIRDPDEAKVFRALDEPGTTWRTASAVARHTGLPESRVSEITHKYHERLTRMSAVPSVTGSKLIGLLKNVR